MNFRAGKPGPSLEDMIAHQERFPLKAAIVIAIIGGLFFLMLSWGIIDDLHRVKARYDFMQRCIEFKSKARCETLWDFQRPDLITGDAR